MTINELEDAVNELEHACAKLSPPATQNYIYRRMCHVEGR